MTITRNGEWEVMDFTGLADLVEREDNALEALSLFEEDFGTTTTVELERITVGHDVIGDTARGGKRNYADKDSAQSETFHIPFFTLDKYVKPNDVQNFRAYATADAPESVNNQVTRSMQRIEAGHSFLKRTAMYTALKGNTYAPNSAGTKYVKNFATVWGVTGDVFTGGVDFTDVNADPALYIEKNCREHIIAQAKDNAGLYQVIALVGAGFFNALTTHPLVQAAFDQYSSNQEPLRNRLAPSNGNSVGRLFEHKGITYIEDVSGEIARGDAYVLPKGIQDMFSIKYAPADTIEHANTVASAMYVFMEETRRAAKMETETSFVCLVTRPELICNLTSNTLPAEA